MSVIRKGRSKLVVVVVAALAFAGACSSSSTKASPTTSAASGSSTSSAGSLPPPTPADTSTQTPCPTPTSCFVSGNVSTVAGGVPGLFKGAFAGTDAYLAYQNALGGLDGRKFKLITGDDDLNCQTNEADTQADISQVIAFTGSFSLYDNCGGQVLKANPQVPDVSVVLDPTTAALPNVFSPQPLAPGMATGPLLFFKKEFPSAITKVGTLVTNVGSAPAQWAGEKAAMEALGYQVVYQRFFSPLETDYTADVLNMERDGVQMVVLIATNDTYGAKLLSDIHTQGFHPQVIWGGASIYSGSENASTFVGDAGGGAVADGVYLEQAQALYLGQDAKYAPEINTFLTWVHGLYGASFDVDLFTLYGWVSAELYVDALKNAGPDPTQASLMAALKRIGTYDADGLLAPVNVSQKVPATCYVLAQVQNGVFQRVDMPANTEFRCDGSYYHASGS